MVAALSAAICFACVVLSDPGVPHTMIDLGIIQKDRGNMKTCLV
jgi:metal-sulfur cluster biosynthetic enzyme